MRLILLNCILDRDPKGISKQKGKSIENIQMEGQRTKSIQNRKECGKRMECVARFSTWATEF